MYVPNFKSHKQENYIKLYTSLVDLLALLQIEIWVDDVPFKKYLETENPVD